MTERFFGDAAILTGRSLRHVTRSLDTIMTTALMPIAFMLLFVYVFGGAINSGSNSKRLRSKHVRGFLSRLRAARRVCLRRLVFVSPMARIPLALPQERERCLRIRRPYSTGPFSLRDLLPARPSLV